MPTKIAAALLATTLAIPVLAEQNVYQLAKQKPAEMVVTKSSSTIKISSSKVYDKYIISVSGDGGFSYQVESNTPELNIYDLELPYDGSYNYEIRAVKNVAEARDTMNNGRAAGAVGKVSVVDVTNGQFTTHYGEMLVLQDKKEPLLGVLPTSNK